MRAIVLVGGEGTRLRPLTYTRPKPLLPVLGTSILERKLAHLARHGVTEAVLSLGYQPDAFLRAFPSGEASGVKLFYAVEPAPLDTAGAIRFAAVHAGYDKLDETLVVVNGDVLSDFDLSAQIATHRSNGALGTIALTQVEDPSVFGVVPTHPDGRVIAFVEKPKREEAPTDWINAGAYVLEAALIGRIADGKRVSIEREIFPVMAAEGTLFAIHAPEYWIDTGTPATFLQANVDLLAAGANYVHESATVAADATLEQASVDRDATVGAGATVRRSVLLPGAHVGEGAIVEDSVLGAGARLGAGSILRALSVLGDGLTVGPGASLSAARIPSP